MTNVQLYRPRRWWAHLQNAIGVVIMIGFGLYLWRHREGLVSVLHVSAWDVLLLALLVVATWVTSSWQTLVLYREAGVPIGFWECLVLAVATVFGNYLPARLGTLIRAHYLKSRYGFRYARLVGITGARTVLMVMATGLVGTAATLGIAAGGGPLSTELLLVFLALCVVPIAAWFWRPRERDGKTSRIQRMLRDFAEGFALLRTRPGMSVTVTALIIGQYATLAWRFYVATVATGSAPSLALLLLMAPMAALTGFVAVTPGGLGLREAVMGYASYAAGAPFSNGIFVGTVDRAVLLGMVTVFGSAAFIAVWVRMRRSNALQHRPDEASTEADAAVRPSAFE